MPFKDPIKRKEYKKKYYQIYCKTHPYKYDKKYHKDWHQKNKKDVKTLKNKREKATREWLISYKTSMKCNKCGFNSHPAALDFHHIDKSKKDKTISQMIRNYGKEAIMKEMDKCEVLCANCHRILHYEEKVREEKQNDSSKRLLNQPNNDIDSQPDSLPNDPLL